MKTETEIILALEELKKSYQLKLKNIETAITCISTASMIVDAVKRCHSEQVKRKLQAPTVQHADNVTVIPPPLNHRLKTR